MLTNTFNEKSETNLYAYEAKDGTLKRVTYRKNLIAELQNSTPYIFDEFNPESINDSTFRKFVAKAAENEIAIYRMIKL